MRTLLLAAILAAIASSAQAADQAPPSAPKYAPRFAAELPALKLHTPYSQVRARLIQLGYRPFHILKRPRGSGVVCDYDQTCRLYPEIFTTSNAGSRFLFEDPFGRRPLVVILVGETPETFVLHALDRADTFDLQSLRDEYVIAKPEPKDHRRGPSNARPQPAPDR